MAKKIRTHKELLVYQRAFDAAIQIFEISKTFPKEELYSLTDQMRRSARSVCANLADAWRKRRYEKAFISKLSDAEAEAAETQVWIEFADRFEYITPALAIELDTIYDGILRTIVSMIQHPATWVIGDRATIREEPLEYGDTL